MKTKRTIDLATVNTGDNVFTYCGTDPFHFIAYHI